MIIGIRLTLNDFKTLIRKMEEENVEDVYIDLDFYGSDTIEFDIWEDREYIKTIFTKLEFLMCKIFHYFEITWIKRNRIINCNCHFVSSF